MPSFLVKKQFLIVALCSGLLGHAFLSTSLKAQEYKTQNYKSKTPSYNAPSTSFLGLTGLNLIPSARHDKVGVVRTGASFLDPYAHVYMGAQIAKPLYINFRQSYEIPSFSRGTP